MNPLLAAASLIITIALVFYTIGVFGERRRGNLEKRDLVFFWLGFACDTTGTSLMSVMAGGTETTLQVHALTGAIAIVLMLVHAVWASVVIAKNSESMRAGFHRFSTTVWFIWLIPYGVGMLMGIPMLSMDVAPALLTTAGVVLFIAFALTLAEDRRNGTRNLMKTNTEWLVVIAGFVWMFAGVNIFRLGVLAYADRSWDIALLALLAAGTIAVFTIFHLRIFNKMVGKHVERIRSYPDPKTNVLKFFDAKGYVMMAIMMGGGIALRMSGLVPEWFIAFFYTGIGFALMVAGISFLGRHFRKGKVKLPCPFVPKGKN